MPASISSALNRVVSPPVDEYERRRRHFGERADREAAVSRRYSRARLMLTLAGAAALVAWLATPWAAVWAPAALLASAGAFLVLAVRHESVERRRDAAAALAALNQDAVFRVRRDWNALPRPWRVTELDDHAFAADLDVFGHASLAQVLGPVKTPPGRATLARWLLDPGSAGVDAVRERQAAVRELAPQLDFRQQFAALARRVPSADDLTVEALSRPALGPFVAWAEEPSWLAAHRWVPLAAVLLGAASTAGIVAWIAGWTPMPWWLLTATAGWILRWWVHVPLTRALDGAAGEHGLRSWRAVMDLAARTPFNAPVLRGAQAELAGRHGHATAALRGIEQLVALADFRLSVWLYLPLQTLTLLELHVWWLIDRWRALHGPDVRHWLSALGHIEALSGLASLAYDHPDWAFPAISAGASRFESAALGHPLLADEVRVTNDVVLGPPGRFLLITGSNMSGKSTLLRAIGLNVVLAQAGGPVCASRLTLPPLSVHTSMRVADSLERGLSLFMASLLRLERIVRAAREAHGSRPVCYLLDEVLQGTNSVERQIAVRTIVGHLLACRAIGAVTTHDLELARDADFSSRADSFHLQETLSGEGDRVAMTFDYRLRPGPAQAGNALQLLRMLGLAEETRRPE